MKADHYKYHYTRIPLYHGGLHVLVANDLAAAYKEAGYADRPNNENINDWGALAWEELNGGKFGVYCLFRPDAEPRLVAHEALHLCTYLMKHVGIQPDLVNDEPMAYLIAWFVHEITYALTSKQVKAKRTIKLR